MEIVTKQPTTLTPIRKLCQFCNWTESMFGRFIPHTHLGG